MASSSVSPVLRPLPADGGSASAAIDSDSYPVPPEWIIADPEENKRRILAMLEQGERDIEAGRTTDSSEVQRRMRERIQARRSSDPQ
jgi:predicted transcriptional regulator